ncbi:hypothetical protein ANN_08232 [Periplaneta americana]|uniref:DUF4817 domain-containing protein n=1 Tax=Periplaneta americana TaxID=6978 RepID=A0ABQ8T0V9_PERAM|nr:hypothetical protein ANN_08232 [Periplaneta americana]
MIFWVTAPSITATQRAYQREFGVRNPPKRNTILGLVNKLEKTGSLVSEKGKHRSSRLPTVVVDVRARPEQSPKKSLRRLSQETGYTYSIRSLCKILPYCPSHGTDEACDDRIISRNLWPRRSPDLTTPDNICYRDDGTQSSSCSGDGGGRGRGRDGGSSKLFTGTSDSRGYSEVVAVKETLRGHSDSSFRGEGYIQCCVGVRLCDMYSNQELAEIHFMYGKADGNAALARRLYQERYPQRQCPDRKTFVRLHYRLCEYGKFNSPGLGRGRPRSTTPEVQEEILEAVNMTPSLSTRRVALQVNVPHTTVWRLLKEYQLYPYHLQRVQALSPADYPARVRFCQWFLQQCGVNLNFPALVLFTDEAQFTRDGITNFHNQHVWAYENPRATVPSHHQVRFSLNMWAGIIGDRLVGPHVLVNRLTGGQAYTNFLENTIPHVLGDTPLINRQHTQFLHDGAPAHFSRTARRYLDRRFPDRWIGRGGPIAWPPRSPDLNLSISTCGAI